MKLALESKSATATRERESKAVNVPFQIKADSMNEEARTFTGLASTWDLDLGGDVIHRGAFKRTLQAWRKAKSVLPLLDSHSAWGTVRAAIGKMLDAEETDEGLVATFEVIDGPDGDEIWRRIKGGYVSGLSIGYRAIKIEQPSDEERLTGVWRHLKEVALQEVSVVMWPMNPGARIDPGSVKAIVADIEALEALARDDELTDEQKAELRQLHRKIGALLGAPGEVGTPDPEAPPEPTPEGEKELAPDDPSRVATERQLWTHWLRTNPGTRALA